MTQDVVGRGQVEIEVRQHEFQQIVLAAQRHLQLGEGQGDLAGFAAVEIGRSNGLQECDGLADALAQFPERLLLIGKARHLERGQPGDGAL
ncbi:hypothetical protein D3C71_1946860 [compost metagenome]